MRDDRNSKHEFLKSLLIELKEIRDKGENQNIRKSMEIIH